MNFALLHQILNACEQYEQSHPNSSDLGHFARWLQVQSAPAPSAARPAAHQELEVTIGRIVFYLTRYAKLYGKKALENAPIGSIDEFVYLAALLQMPQGISKSELIRYNRHEKPTGMEIIRRLIVPGFAVQEPDPNDRRGALLKITPAGRQVLLPLFEKMGMVSRIIVGNLSVEEQALLAGLLEKLENFHQRILDQHKESGLETIYEAATRPDAREEPE